jgi:membrane-bound lytic murein transglycosylase D
MIPGRPLRSLRLRLLRPPPAALLVLAALRVPAALLVVAALVVLAAVLVPAALLVAPSSLQAQATSAPVAPTLLSMVPTAPNPAFPLPKGLEPQVEFWKAIYSRVGANEVLFHDRSRMDVVYGKLWLPEAKTTSAELTNRNILEATRERYHAILAALASGFDPDTLAGETRRVYELWGRATPGAFAEAAENVRWQRGLRERFLQGLAFSGRYQFHVEQIFREEGVPLELTFLPFVESTYNTRAYSSAGAAGVWQFMPGTGRLFMRVDGTVDERMDPIRAARAAARLLRNNYESLGTWPLAITAYNHGPYGMKNAVRTMGTTDIERIVKGYEGRGFGFASRNFYTEFLAALEVRRNFAAYFGEVRLDPTFEFDEVTTPVVVRFSALAQALAIPVEALWDMNPAFTPNARREDRPVPAGYHLRLPPGSSGRWGEVLAGVRARPGGSGIPQDAPPSGARAWYVVRAGDSLGAIADRHGVALSTLERLNGLSRNAVIHPGQRLRVSP